MWDLFSEEITLKYMSTKKFLKEFLKENSLTDRLKRVQINLFYSTLLWLLNSAKKKNLFVYGLLLNSFGKL